MEHQEYPKALYLKGAMLTASDYEEEERLRDEGYQDWQADHEADQPTDVDFKEAAAMTYHPATSLDHNPDRDQPTEPQQTGAHDGGKGPVSEQPQRNKPGRKPKAQ